MRLNGKTAIVTGAASGFGAGIARKFAAEGAQVMVVDINHDGAMGMAAELGNGAFGHVCNVADGAQVNETVETALRIMGGVDILVNNAAANPYYGHILDTDLIAFSSFILEIFFVKYDRL